MGRGMAGGSPAEMARGIDGGMVARECAYDGGEGGSPAGMVRGMEGGSPAGMEGWWRGNAQICQSVTIPLK